VEEPRAGMTTLVHGPPDARKIPDI
jgi:hypothetical protein